MRFFLDVNVGSRVADALTGLEHDVVRAALTNPTAEDSEILRVAVEGERILITYDRDFSELVFNGAAEAPPAIIYLRFRTRDVEVALAHLIPALDFAQLNNHMTVIDDRHVRHTPLPRRQNDNG